MLRVKIKSLLNNVVLFSTDLFKIGVLSSLRTLIFSELHIH